jgi:hypothetical protein
MTDFIHCVENAISHDVCDQVLQYIHSNSHLFENREYVKTNNVLCDSIFLFKHHDEESCKIDRMLFEAIHDAIHDHLSPKLKDDVGTPQTFLDDNKLFDSGYEVRRINGPTRMHYDCVCPEMREDGISYRMGTIVISLSESNDYLVFPVQNRSAKLSKGTMVFFPPYWTHPHYTIYGDEQCYRVQTWLCISS